MSAGTVIADRYELLDALGSGGMGTTWRARDRQLGNDVAIKLLRMDRVEDWKVIELFEREARTLASLTHPGVPRYIDAQAGGDDGWYLVQELAPGRSLEDLLTQRLPEEALRSIASQILDVLVYLQTWSPPVIHRDIKPSNLIVDDAGRVKVVDFGAACRSITDTQLGGSTVVGTFGYMAPEQFRGVATAATDLYGLGMTLVHVATGVEPSQLPTERMAVQFRDRVQLTPGVVAWLERMTAPALEDRFQSATEALAALQHVDDYRDLPAFPWQGSRSVTVLRHDDGVELEITPRSMRGAGVFFVLFGAVWSVISTIAAISMIVDTGGELGAVFLGTLFAGLGWVMIVAGVHQFRMREWFTLRGQRWIRRWRAFPWGEKEQEGATTDIMRIDAVPNGTKVNGQSLYVVHLETRSGLVKLGSGLAYGEAFSLAEALSAMVGLETPRHAGPFDQFTAQFKAMFDGMKGGGALKGLARLAAHLPAVQEAVQQVSGSAAPTTNRPGGAAGATWRPEPAAPGARPASTQASSTQASSAAGAGQGSAHQPSVIHADQRADAHSDTGSWPPR